MAGQVVTTSRLTAATLSMTEVTSSLTADVPTPGAVEVVSPDAAVAGGGGSGAAAAAGATTPVVQVEVQAAPQTSQLGVVSVTVPAETATVGAGFVFTLPTDLVAQFNTEVRVSLVLLWLRQAIAICRNATSSTVGSSSSITDSM